MSKDEILVVPSHPGYAVTIDGRVLNVNRGRWMRLTKKARGGPGVMLYNQGVQTYFLVHRLVASLFMKDFDPSREVIHKDGNKENNHIDNLTLGGPLYNWRKV